MITSSESTEPYSPCAIPLQKLGGASVILATAPSGKAMSMLVAGLGANRTLVVVGASEEPIEVPPIQLLFGRKRIQGWPSGIPTDSEDTLRFAEVTGARPMIEKYRLARAAGEVHGHGLDDWLLAERDFKLRVSGTDCPLRGAGSISRGKEEYMGKLEGKIALVTGGTSGIGLATAKQFVNEGAYVFITGRRGEELEGAVKEIGRGVTGVQDDVSKLFDLDRLFAQIESEKGRLDVLFANAGVAKYGRLGAICEELFDSIFDVNVKGVLFTVQKALPLMPDGASIILNANCIAGSD